MTATERSAQSSPRERRAELAPDLDDFFAPQRTSRSDLPDPRLTLNHITHNVIEVLSGARDIEQLSRWVTDEVYQGLQKRAVLAARARRLRGVRARRPVFSVGRIRMIEPSDGIVEAVVMVVQRQRCRAVVIRLEGLDSRWRATVVAVL